MRVALPRRRTSRKSAQNLYHGDSSPYLQRLGIELLEDGRLLSVSSPSIGLFSTSSPTFAENHGQWEGESVRYAHLGSGANVLPTDGGSLIQLSQQEDSSVRETHNQAQDSSNDNLVRKLQAPTPLLP